MNEYVDDNTSVKDAARRLVSHYRSISGKQSTRIKLRWIDQSNPFQQVPIIRTIKEKPVGKIARIILTPQIIDEFVSRLNPKYNTPPAAGPCTRPIGEDASYAC